MRYACVLLFLATVTVSAQLPGEKPAASKQVRKYLEYFCDLIHKKGLYGDSIDWNHLQVKVADLSRGMTQIDETRPVLDTIMRALRKAGDKHTFYLTKAQWENGNTGNAIRQDPVGKLVGEEIGYIKVPGFLSFGSGLANTFAESIQNRIRELDQGNQVVGWVVDLRHNTGGDIHAMVAGLGALRPDGIYAYTDYPRLGPDDKLSYSKGNCGSVRVKNPYKVKNTAGKIAILVDSMTGSSGEFAAISFKSYPNARFFGRPTAGYTTSNFTYVLSDRTLLNLATGYMADINHKTYLEGLVPDVLIPLGTDTKDDLTLEAAKKWIEEK